MTARSPALLTALAVLASASATVGGQDPTPVSAIVPASIDTHAHLRFPPSAEERGSLAAAATALAMMDRLGIGRSLLMPPPFPDAHEMGYDFSALAAVVRRYPDRFGFLAGGGSLNPMIQEAVVAGEVGTKLARRFEQRAEEIVAAGAVGFGEMTAEHLSFHRSHPYLAAPPDHPLFLLLADVAARHDVPIDLHMEAIEHDIELPEAFASPPNPPRLSANVDRLERLLSHQPAARIVWVHIGWDNTGHMTTALLERLLKAHDNLYLSLKVVERAGLQRAENRPVAGGRLRPEWRALITAFPDRFVLGADEFYSSPGAAGRMPRSTEATWLLLSQLPPDLARAVGHDNAIRIYRLAGS